MEEVKISVVTVVYNGVESIENTILSVRNQTYDNIEYVIIDGGSTDGSLYIIKKYQDKISFWVSEPDNGIYDALNKGIKYATGDYIIFMNCGDLFFSNETLKNVYLSGMNEDVIYGDTVVDTKDEKQFSKAKEIENIKYGMVFCHQSVFVKLDIMKKYNFNLIYKLASDYDFFMFLYATEKYSFKKIDEIICIYDNFGASRSLLTLKEKFIISKLYNPFSISMMTHYFDFKYYTFTAFLKRKLPKNIVNKIIKLKKWL